MEESYGKDPASHPDPESCVDGRKAGSEALTGAHAGQPSSCEIRSTGVPTPLCEAEGNTEGGVIGKPSRTPRSRRPCARVETLRTGNGRSHGHPPPMVGRVGRGRSLTSSPTCTPVGSRTVA